jgi:hypothetical protein
VFRDIEIDLATGTGLHSGRNVIAVIGIDRYRAWPRLTNAVNEGSCASSRGWASSRSSSRSTTMRRPPTRSGTS